MTNGVAIRAGESQHHGNLPQFMKLHFMLLDAWLSLWPCQLKCCSLSGRLFQFPNYSCHSWQESCQNTGSKMALIVCHLDLRKCENGRGDISQWIILFFFFFLFFFLTVCLCVKRGMRGILLDCISVLTFGEISDKTQLYMLWTLSFRIEVFDNMTTLMWFSCNIFDIEIKQMHMYLF